MLSIFIVYSKCCHEYKKNIWKRRISWNIKNSSKNQKILSCPKKTQFKHLDLEKTDEIRNYLI